MHVKRVGHTKKWPPFLASNAGQRTTSFGALKTPAWSLEAEEDGINHQFVDEEIENDAVDTVEQHAEYTLAQITP